MKLFETKHHTLMPFWSHTQQHQTMMGQRSPGMIAGKPPRYGESAKELELGQLPTGDGPDTEVHDPDTQPGHRIQTRHIS